MRFTERGEAVLEEYLRRVRRSLEGREDVDAADVVAGIREHVVTELTVGSVAVATVEEVTEVLARIGPAESLAGSPPEESAGEQAGRGVALAVLVLAATGIALLATRFMPVGVALLLTGVIGARVIVGRGAAGGSVEHRLVRVLWQLGVVGAALVVLIGPAVLVWGSAQIGGVLEGSLARYADVVGRERPLRYWGAMAAVAGVVSGVWWVFLGFLLRGRGAEIRRVLGPARGVIPERAARMLVRVGVALLLISCLGLWIS
jgi:hypothetical protein